MILDARAGVEDAPVGLRDRDVLLAFIAGLVVAICWRDPGDGSLSQLSSDVFRERSGIGGAELFALAVLGTLAFRFHRESLLTRSDLAMVAIASLAFALPLRFAASVPLTLVGAKLVFGSDPRVRSFGQILLALSFYEWLGPLFSICCPLWFLGRKRSPSRPLSLRLAGSRVTV